ncbi:hypothetical protein OE88DRAFT_1645739 [Heliocybe sulcata]|uniref:Skg3/CAF120-like PH-like domain-containing protein n=1 Tax=Heliocybe sulcata TaxID=5364 RepID=A0A5C3MXP0_9AGAM|nr:hypothetical protein OE88DRAFT_1645739 [Heliocybe sulcata]
MYQCADPGHNNLHHQSVKRAAAGPDIEPEIGRSLSAALRALVRYEIPLLMWEICAKRNLRALVRHPCNGPQLPMDVNPADRLKRPPPIYILCRYDHSRLEGLDFRKWRPTAAFRAEYYRSSLLGMEPPPTYEAPSYLGLDIANASVPFSSINTTVPSYAFSSELPDNLAFLQTTRPGSSGEAAPSQQPRALTENSYNLYDNRGRSWMTLKLKSHALSPTLLPAYYEGDPITGSLHLCLRHPDSIKAIGLKLNSRGKITGRLINTRTSGYDIFCRLKHTVWNPSAAQPSPGEYTAKLKGPYSWPFSIELPPEVYVRGVAYPLPPTFQDKDVQFTVQYDISVRLRRGRMQTDSKRPPPPSIFRQLSYLQSIPLLGPEEDREGWISLHSVQISGSVFKIRPVRATCELCYTRGSVIPCFLSIKSDDRHVLDLLSSPKAPLVHLVQRVGFQANNTGERDVQAAPSRIAVSVTSESNMATAVWWPPADEGSIVRNERRLEGEVHLPSGLTPTCTFPGFVVTYSLVMYRFEAAGYAPSSSGTESVASVDVEIVTAHAAGPRARRYAPPAYHSAAESRSFPTDAGFSLLVIMYSRRNLRSGEPAPESLGLVVQKPCPAKRIAVVPRKALQPRARGNLILPSTVTGPFPSNFMSLRLSLRRLPPNLLCTKSSASFTVQSRSKSCFHALWNGRVRATNSLQRQQCLAPNPWYPVWRGMSNNAGRPGPSLARHPSGRPMTRNEVYAAKNKSLMMYTTAVIVLVVGVTFASVPLYRVFCAATGFAGTPVVGQGKFEAERLVPVEGARRIKVHFNADTSDQLPWKFIPQQQYVTVLPGETSLAFYRARNNSDKDIVGIATYNVTPDRIAPYFAKVECFCFEEQKLLAGEEVDMPLLFFIDKDILDDPTCRKIDDVVLSYTFFRARRNAQGNLEPDAPEGVVQNSLGFGEYEHAPKAEHPSGDREPTTRREAGCAYILLTPIPAQPVFSFSLPPPTMASVSSAGKTMASTQWENRNRGFVPPSELKQWRQSTVPHEFRQQGNIEQPDEPAAPTTPPPPMPSSSSAPSTPPQPGKPVHNHSRSTSSSFFSFRSRNSSQAQADSHQQSHSAASAPQPLSPGGPGASNVSTLARTTTNEFGQRAPQMDGPQPAPPTQHPPRPSMQGRTSTSISQPAAQPLHPEIRSVVQLNLAHTNKVYQWGKLTRRIERQPDGQRPAKEEGWTEVWAQLSGTILSIWDMKEVEEAGKQGREVPPSYINITDAFVQVLGAVTVPATPTVPAQKYTNVITLNTAGSNLILFSCPSTPALISWASAIRLSAWEKSRLEEIYTCHLIRITLKEGANCPTTLAKGRMEGWVRIRVAGQTDWKRLWMVVAAGTGSGRAPDTPSGEGRPESPTAPRKKRRSTLFGREHSPQQEGPIISLHNSPKPKDKKRPVLTMQAVTQAFAVYPERPDLISRSTLIKLEGTIGEEEMAVSMRNRQAWLLVMPELEGGNVQAAEMLRWLIAQLVPTSTAIHDSFELYGRPNPYLQDPRDPASLMFAYPVGPHKDLLFLDRELAETVDPRDDRTAVVRQRFTDILHERMRTLGPENQARAVTSEQAGGNKMPDNAPRLPPLPEMSPEESDALPQLPPLSFDSGSSSQVRTPEKRMLTPITERSVRESPTDVQSPPSTQHSGGSVGRRPSARLDGVQPPPIPEAPQEQESVSSPNLTTSPAQGNMELEGKHSEDSHSGAPGSRPDSKFSHDYRSKLDDGGIDNTAHAPTSPASGRPSLSISSPRPMSPPVPAKSPGRSALPPLPSPSTSATSLGRGVPPRTPSPPHSVLTSPYSAMHDSPAKRFAERESMDSLPPRISQDWQPLPSPNRDQPVPPPPPVPAKPPSVASHNNDNLLADAGAALYYMQIQQDGGVAPKPARPPPVGSEDEESDYGEDSDESPAHAPPSSPPPPRFAGMRRGSTQSGSSNASFGARAPIIRRPSGARAPTNSRRLVPERRSSSPQRRVQESPPQSSATAAAIASSNMQHTDFDGPDADALAALTFLEREENPETQQKQQPAVPPPPPPQVLEPADRAPSPHASSDGASQYRSSFAPSKSAMERKAKSQAKEAAHEAAVHRPGRAADRRKGKARDRGAWNDSSEEEEEEEEEEDEDEDEDEEVGSDAEPPASVSSRANPPAPAGSSSGHSSRHMTPRGASGPLAETSAYAQPRPPRHLPQTPSGARPMNEVEDYQSTAPRPPRMMSDNYSRAQTQYDDGPRTHSPHSRQQPDMTPPGAARQNVWSQVLEPGARHGGPPPPPASQQRDTFVQIEPPSATMTKAFAPQGLLSAGLAEKEDRSAKKQEELARETGASLINVPNKPPPPQTGLLGAISAHERERKREGGFGAALTEREREKRMAEERQRKLDEMQRQQLEQMSQYGGQFPYNPMMGNPMMSPMMMGMNPMMTGYMSYPGMLPNPGMMTGMQGYGNPHMFAAQQAAQAYQQAMMAFSSAGSQHGGEGGGSGSPPALTPMMTGGSMAFDPRMSMMGMPMMGMPPMGMGMQMTGGSNFDPRFSQFDPGLRPPGEFGGGPRFSPQGSQSGSPSGPRPVDPGDEPPRMSASASPKPPTPRS